MKFPNEFLLNKLRDLQLLPLVGGLSKVQAIFLGSVVYVVTILSLVLSLLSFTFFDSLKVEKSYVTTTTDSRSCVILSAISKTYSLGYKSEPGAALDLFVNYPGVTYDLSRFGLLYDSVYFASLDKCKEIINRSSFQCESRPPTGKYDCTLYMTNITLKAFSFGTKDDNEKLANRFFNSTNMCVPFERLSPYLCTKLEILPYFSIISQSFALATTTMGVLFAILPLILKRLVLDEKPMTDVHEMYSNPLPSLRS